MRRTIGAALIAWCAAFGIVATAAAEPIGYMQRPAGGEFYAVDLGTATATQVGSTVDLRGLAVAPDGTLYGVGFAENAHLWTVNKTNGSATDVGPLGYSQVGAGLSFTADGRLWTTRIPTSNAASTLYEVNPATGATTLVGANGAGISISGLAGTCDGTLWGLGFESGQALLFRIDTATGAATKIGTGLGGGISSEAFGFDADANGTMWGITTTAQQFVVDPVTGLASNVETMSGVESSNSVSSLGIAPIVPCGAPPEPQPEPEPGPSGPPAATPVGASPRFTG
jgi:hypothetical protein